MSQNTDKTLYPLTYYNLDNGIWVSGFSCEDLNSAVTRKTSSCTFSLYNNVLFTPLQA